MNILEHCIKICWFLWFVISAIGAIRYWYLTVKFNNNLFERYPSRREEIMKFRWKARTLSNAIRGSNFLGVQLPEDIAKDEKISQQTTKITSYFNRLIKCILLGFFVLMIASLLSEGVN
ncbi:MAG: hypothetical protein ACYTER_08935 [Planctomycetota bacterium]|jgi:hypothetical protein